MFDGLKLPSARRRRRRSSRAGRAGPYP
jgi:hypothetical protein